MVWDCAGDYWISAGGKTSCTNRATPVRILAFFFIVFSLLSFVAAQLILKRAMELSATLGFRNSRFISLAAIGIALMTVSFFITLTAAVVLKEKLSLRLIVGAVLISAGIVLVSMS